MSSTVLDQEAPATGPVEHYHIFHADAHVLSGELKRPIEQKIEQQIPVALKDRRGGHFTRFSEDFSVEGFISYKRGLTRVSGSPSSKPRPGSEHVGWTTLSTSILEGLNVFEVITVDRLVSQVSTDHAYVNGHVPFVTFLGTQFQNVQVSGYPIKPILNLGLCGKKPDNDMPYVTDSKFLDAAREQVDIILNSKGLPPDLQTEYLGRLNAIEEQSKSAGTPCSNATRIKCSLVQTIDVGNARIPGLQVIGNVLVIPEFGTVALGEIEVGVEMVDSPEVYEKPGGYPEPSNYFKLTMFDMRLGCIGSGTVAAGSSKSNGNTRP
jgi:hypothetical protein